MYSTQEKDLAGVVDATPLDTPEKSLSDAFQPRDDGTGSDDGSSSQSSIKKQRWTPTPNGPKDPKPRFMNPGIYLWLMYLGVWGIVAEVFEMLFSVLGLVKNFVSMILACFYLVCKPKQLEAPVVVVTGGSSGIGAEFARQYAKNRKARIILAARRVGRLKQMAEECKALGATEAHAVRYDASTKDGGLKLAAAVKALGFEAVDVLSIHAGKEADWGFVEWSKDGPRNELVMDVNFHGPIRAVYAFLPHLKKSRFPQVMVNTSALADIPWGTWADYNASKAGVSHWFDCFRAQVMHHGIQVSVVKFGLVHSEMSTGNPAFRTTNGKKLDRREKMMKDAMDTDKAVSDCITMFDAGFGEIYVPEQSNRFIIWAIKNGYVTSTMLLDKEDQAQCIAGFPDEEDYV